MVRRKPEETVEEPMSRRRREELKEEEVIKEEQHVEQAEELEDFDFESDLNIDPDSLDIEWLNQPKLLMKYSKFEADAKAELEKAKEYVAFVKAETAMLVRKNPSEYGVDKATNDAVNEIVASDANVREAVQRQNKIQHLLNLVTNMVRAIEQRKSSLENLVKLFGMEYFASPSDSRTLGEKVEAMRLKELSKESVISNMRKAMKERKGE